MKKQRFWIIFLTSLVTILLAYLVYAQSNSQTQPVSSGTNWWSILTLAGVGIIVLLFLLCHIFLLYHIYDKKVYSKEIYAKESQNQATLAEQIYSEGWKLFDQKEVESLQQAIIKWQKALSLYQKINDYSKEANILIDISVSFDILRERQKSLNYFQQALSLSRSVGGASMEADTIYQAATFYNYILGKKQRALDCYLQVLSVIQDLPIFQQVKVHKTPMKIMALSHIATMYSELGEKQKALDYCQLTLSLSKEVGDESMEVTTLLKFGSLYESLREKQKALDYYQQSLSLSKKIGDELMEEKTLFNMATMYFQWGEKQKALDYYQQSLSLSKKLADEFMEEEIISNIDAINKGLTYDDFIFQQSIDDLINNQQNENNVSGSLPD